MSRVEKKLKRIRLNTILFVCLSGIFALEVVATSYYSLSARAIDYIDPNSLELPDLWHDFYVHTEFTNFDQQNGKANLKIDVSLPLNLTSIDASALDVEIFQVRPFIIQRSNVTLTKLSFGGSYQYFGSQTIVFDMESHRDLYPFDYGTFRILLSFPANASEQPSVWGVRMPEELSGNWFIRGLKINWSDNKSLTIDYVLWRPYSYQLQNLIPMWLIFLTLCATAKIDASTGSNRFQVKLSIYLGLLIYTLSFSAIALTFVAQVSEGLRISLMSGTALSIIVDIITFSRRNKKHTIDYEKGGGEPTHWIRKLGGTEDLPFVAIALLLSFYAFTSISKYSHSPWPFNLGPIYLYTFLTPIFIAFASLYFLKRRIWIIIALPCFLLSLAVLHESLIQYMFSWI